MLLILTLVQDVRERAVSVVVFPLLMLCLTSMAVLRQPVTVVLEAWVLNVLFLGAQIGILYLYFLLTRRRMVAVVGSALGLGDILFWIVAAVFFSFPNFVLFFLASLVFALGLHYILRYFGNSWYGSTVPLAGFQAFALSVLLVVQRFYGLDFYGDKLILRLFM